jgi:hypothetical protein
MKQSQNIQFLGVVKNVQVINSDGSVAFETGEFKNLILDQGLNEFAVRELVACFTVCSVGTGATPPTVADQNLVAKVASTQNYLTGPGNFGTTFVDAFTTKFRRTFDFPSPASNTNYSELGFGWSLSSSNTLFSRVLIKVAGVPTAVTVTTTQQLRVVYELTATISSADQAVNVNFGGAWGTVTGVGRVQNTTQAWNNLETNGNYSNYWYGWAEPSGYSLHYIVASDDTTALSVAGVSKTVASQPTAINLSTYVNGQFYREKNGIFGLGAAPGPKMAGKARWNMLCVLMLPKPKPTQAH